MTHWPTSLPALYDLFSLLPWWVQFITVVAAGTIWMIGEMSRAPYYSIDDNGTERMD